uniref:Uncharacterized protein n=1 Tax=Oryza glumipatula TaxID=40148 RepID=A0A0E0BLP7_9ORYZ
MDNGCADQRLVHYLYACNYNSRVKNPYFSRVQMQQIKNADEVDGWIEERFKDQDDKLGGWNN